MKEALGTEIRAGADLPFLVKEPITKAQLVQYAGASGDYNLIHTDDETARQVGLPGVIAHGMVSMGFLGQYLAGIFGPESIRRLAVRFSAMVRPGDSLICKGAVREVAGNLAVLEVWAEIQRGERVTAGEAEVFVAE